MAETKIKMDPPHVGVRRTLDVDGPTQPKDNTKDALKSKQNTPDQSKEQRVNTTTALSNTPHHKLKTLSSTSESSTDELSSIWGYKSRPTPSQNAAKVF
jgi:hypothetical protein